MYYCNNCNQYITPILADDMCTDICPECRDTDFEKANQCEICGQPIRSHEDYCEECLGMAERYILELSTELGITNKIAKDLLMAVMEKEK